MKRNVLVAAAVGIVLGWFAAGMGSSAQSSQFPIPQYAPSCHWEIAEAGGAAMLLNKCNGEAWMYVNGEWRLSRGSPPFRPTSLQRRKG